MLTTSDPGLTTNEMLTLVVAVVAIGLSAGSLALGIVAVVQTKYYFLRPHFKFFVTPSSQAKGVPSVIVHVSQRGPAGAHDVKFEVCKPGGNWQSMRTQTEVPAHTRFNWWEGLADTSDVAIWDISGVSSRTLSTGDAIAGVWKWRVRWSEAPDPNKERTETAKHRVTKRAVRRGTYLATG
ncbi:hypothetical protein I6E68_10570 [Salinibacterium sp. NSLL150]|uniref:hypothetical protein n=1 Tax=unclassified Salinibacterium TaxID=2632331 RepID=UPI0018CFCECF|nr:MULTISPECIES: hypothetical protein [unclassified Salinibacterium]MBH0099580.1 hypothetical protein [Salinibacterium sp. NSLL35]MBH0102334.1 hypothetical protein [Salinibacterium sp. NSLL150]MBH0105094.1 hypothetical protein [Salinibacterium sp. NSLL16]MBH0107854.1 hypothetical protein [Salinibacterium sp. NSLL17]